MGLTTTSVMKGIGIFPLGSWPPPEKWRIWEKLWTWREGNLLASRHNGRRQLILATSHTSNVDTDGTLWFLRGRVVWCCTLVKLGKLLELGGARVGPKRLELRAAGWKICRPYLNVYISFCAIQPAQDCPVSAAFMTVSTWQTWCACCCWRDSKDTGRGVSFMFPSTYNCVCIVITAKSFKWSP